jgi:hypothetical protein
MMEAELTAKRGPDWFLRAACMAGLVHASWMTLLGIWALFIDDNFDVGMVLGLTLVGALGGSVLFIVFGGFIHVILGLFGVRFWWSYLTAGLVWGLAMGEGIVSLGMLIPNATGPHPYGTDTRLWIDGGLMGLAGVSAMIGWWYWSRSLR